LIAKVSFTMVIKLLIRTTTLKFFVGCVPSCPELLGKTSDPTSAEGPLFAAHGPVWLFSVPKGENVEVEQVSRHRRDKMKRDDTAVGCSKESVWGLLWKWLGLQHSRLVTLFFQAFGWILFLSGHIA
jgi:hypothetical protein